MPLSDIDVVFNQELIVPDKGAGNGVRIGEHSENNDQDIDRPAAAEGVFGQVKTAARVNRAAVFFNNIHAQNVCPARVFGHTGVPPTVGAA